MICIFKFIKSTSHCLRDSIKQKNGDCKRIVEYPWGRVGLKHCYE